MEYGRFSLRPGGTKQTIDLLAGTMGVPGAGVTGEPAAGIMAGPLRTKKEPRTTATLDEEQ
ncbi:hypothetical protein PtA15_5A124 [Puccinia triticina]|uniref:Uncharacterized protein n=1 Tax=Puccinia triticina TaxID=208348 RepID=A0ABY7CH29_9BASI|nr:uncharacterized protein PtA15_5A124 [Puccinia triticina]WAQ84554.1 hypothetical protein PtA15_5A124 [Puccinia triticina]